MEVGAKNYRTNVLKSKKFTKVADKYEKTVTEDQLSAKFDPTRKYAHYFE